MATTRPLNDVQTVWVTTYFGGEGVGTCFDLTAQINPDTQITATFTQAELIELIRQHGNQTTLRRPSFDHG